MIGYEVEFRGFEEQIERLRQFDQIADRRLVAAMGSSVVTIQGHVRPLTPVNLGHLRNSIGTEVKHIASLNIEGRVGSTLQGEVYPVVMEFGAKPHFPNLANLSFWVMRKLGVSGWQGIAVTYRIALKIARSGIRGREYMKRGWEASQASVNRFFTQALEFIAQDLAGR